jgi:hypothetical protein
MSKENYDNNSNSNGAVVFFNLNRKKALKRGLKGQSRIYSIVLLRAKKLYDNQIDKSSCSLYADCILEVIKNTKGITEAVFKARFAETVIDLMDKMSFNYDCKQRKLSPYVVATHLAAMPSNQRKKILEDMSKLPDRVRMCKTPIFELDDLTNMDKYQVLSDEMPEVTPDENGAIED